MLFPFFHLMSSLSCPSFFKYLMGYHAFLDAHQVFSPSHSSVGANLTCLRVLPLSNIDVLTLLLSFLLFAWCLRVMGICNTGFFWRWVVHIYNIGPYYYEGLVVVILSNICRASEICGGSKSLIFWNVADMFVPLGLERERG